MMINYKIKRKFFKATILLIVVALLASMINLVVFAQNYTEHTVVTGESLSSIASKYNVSIQAIVDLNGIKDKAYVVTGTVLRIPGVGAKEQADVVSTTKTAATTAISAAKEVAAKATAATEARIASVESTTASTTTGTTATKIEATTADTNAVSSSNIPVNKFVATMSTKVSVNFQQADVRDVLSGFAINLGYNFIFKGTPVPITITLKDVAISKALDYIVKMIGMTYITDGKTIIFGEKNDLISNFSDALQIAEFKLKYITADVLSSQISTLGLSVTVMKIGTNQKSLVVRGLPVDLARVRDLLSMIDKKTNTVLNSAQITSSFFVIKLNNISAVDFSTVLTSLSLPTGVTLPDKPDTIYVYASPADYESILSLKAIVDTKSSLSSTESPADSKITTEKVILKNVSKDVVIPFLNSLELDIKVIDITNMQKTIWIKGLAADIAQAKASIATIDSINTGLNNSFKMFTLDNVSAEEMQNKLDTLKLTDVASYTFAYPGYSKNILVSFGSDMETTILQLITSLDVPSNLVTLMIDSSDVASGQYKLLARKSLIAEMAEIDIKKFLISGDVSKTDTPKYILYLKNATLAEIKKARDVVEELG